MRRLTIAVLVATLFFVGHQAAQTALAVTYAPGWNLVSGPQGSILSGATGNIYTLQPGDADYESFAASSPLHGGWGYWALFPNGGSITFGASAPSLTITPVPGAFLMLGNPSQSVATITGADSVLLYTPSGGYQESTVIPPGQGAWVTASGQIALSAATDSAPVAAAPAPIRAPTVASAPAPAPVTAPIPSTSPTTTGVNNVVSSVPSPIGSGLTRDVTSRIDLSSIIPLFVHAHIDDSPIGPWGSLSDATKIAYAKSVIVGLHTGYPSLSAIYFFVDVSWETSFLPQSVPIEDVDVCGIHFCSYFSDITARYSHGIYQYQWAYQGAGTRDDWNSFP